MAEFPGSKKARWTARLLGLGSTVALLSVYGWLTWSIGTAKEALRSAETKAQELEVKRGELEGQIKERSSERDSLKEEAKRVDEQLEAKKTELEEKEKLIEGLRVAAENASPGEVQQQVLAAMRAKTPLQRAEALYAAGKTARKQNQAERAQKLFEAAINEMEYAPALNALGRVIADNNGGLKEAEGYYERAMKADATYVYPIHNMAHLMRMWGKFDEARKYAKQALAVDGDYEPAKLLLKELGEE